MTRVTVVQLAGDTILLAANVRVPDDAGPYDILVVATAAEVTTRVRVQVQQTRSSGDWAAEGASPLYLACARDRNQVAAPAKDAGPRPPAVRRGARRSRTAGGLTGRELEIMLLVAQGNTSRQIGRALFISPRTVEMHVQGSLLKLGCRTRAEAVRRLAELGTLAPRAPHADAAAGRA